VRLWVIAAAGAGVWLLRNAPTDPRQWPGAARAEAGRLRGQAKEAFEAGKRASARRQDEVQREIDEASQPRQY
jgi:hypothetical protein